VPAGKHYKYMKKQPMFLKPKRGPPATKILTCKAKKQAQLRSPTGGWNPRESTKKPAMAICLHNHYRGDETAEAHFTINVPDRALGA
jgi:hypothetical protein